jgi:uncharacterized membrane protein
LNPQYSDSSKVNPAQNGQINENERHVYERFLHREHVSRDIGHEFRDSLTFGQRTSDRIAIVAGSWPFVILFIVLLTGWIILNTLVLTGPNEAFDPYPYILLNLFLSMLAAIQAPIILMSQNRQMAKDRAEASHDYEVNLKSEIEIMSLQSKINRLREDEINELIEYQERQILLLEQIRDLLQSRPPQE